MFNNRDLNIDQNNRDYDFCHDRAALLEQKYSAAARFSEQINTIVFAKAGKENITSDGNYRIEALSGSLAVGNG